MLGLVLFNFELFFKFKKRSKKDGSQISKNKKIPKKRGVKKLELPNNLEQDWSQPYLHIDESKVPSLC